MPNIKSSKKDVISSKIAYEKNKANKSELKTNLKKFESALESGDKAVAEGAYKQAIKAVDQAVTKAFFLGILAEFYNRVLQYDGDIIDLKV